MSKKVENVKEVESAVKCLRGFSPFTSRFNASKQSDFDKFYDDVEEKVIFVATGQKDDDGNDIGVSKIVRIVHKVDIQELLNSQADSVGVESYMRALALQGDSIDNYHTLIDNDKVLDFSNMPNTLADVMSSGDNAKKAFADMDPDLKGGHTTIEGFLNSLTKETIDKYIAGKLEALKPVKKEGE